MSSGLGSTIFTLLLPQQLPWHRSGPVLNDGVHQRPFPMGSLDDMMSKVVSTDLQGLCTMKNFKSSPHSPGASSTHTTQNHTDMDVQPKVKNPQVLCDTMQMGSMTALSPSIPTPALNLALFYCTDIINTFLKKEHKISIPISPASVI